jgi:hypothetical protein
MLWISAVVMILIFGSCSWTVQSKVLEGVKAGQDPMRMRCALEPNKTSEACRIVNKEIKNGS